MKERYTRNIPAISEKEQERLAEKSVAVIGCGGLGGYIIEELARLGVGQLAFVDGDVFSESNLNRQLLSSVESIGKPKAEIAEAHIKKINPEIKLIAVKEFMSAEKIADFLEGCDLLMDALDNVPDRLILEDICAKKKIPLVHGAVKGWSLQLTVSEPGSKTLHKLYSNSQHRHQIEDKADKTCLCFTPACCASLQLAEALKLLTGRPSSLSGKLFCMDLLSMESYTIDL